MTRRPRPTGGYREPTKGKEWKWPESLSLAALGEVLRVVLTVAFYVVLAVPAGIVALAVGMAGVEKLLGGGGKGAGGMGGK